MRCEEKVEDTLQSAEKNVFTCYRWTSGATESSVTISADLNDNKWVKHSCVLQITAQRNALTSQHADQLLLLKNMHM